MSDQSHIWRPKILVTAVLRLRLKISSENISQAYHYHYSYDRGTYNIQCRPTAVHSPSATLLLHDCIGIDSGITLKKTVFCVVWQCLPPKLSFLFYDRGTYNILRATVFSRLHSIITSTITIFLCRFSKRNMVKERESVGMFSGFHLESFQTWFQSFKCCIENLMLWGTGGDHSI